MDVLDAADIDAYMDIAREIRAHFPSVVVLRLGGKVELKVVGAYLQARSTKWKKEGPTFEVSLVEDRRTADVTIVEEAAAVLYMLSRLLQEYIRGLPADSKITDGLARFGDIIARLKVAVEEAEKAFKKLGGERRE